MSSFLPAAPHRLDRLRSWMEEAQLDCTVVVGSDHVTHLCGYSRYFGGPSALVVDRDGGRTLVVMRDELPIATESSAAELVIGYGERGFGFDLDPIAGLVTALAAQPTVARAGRFGIASELPHADARLAAHLSGTSVDASKTLAAIRLIKDRDELERILASYNLCWRGQAAVLEAADVGVSEIELFSTAQTTAQVGAERPIEFICDLLSGTSTANVCCPIHVAGPRQLEQGDAIIADVVVRSNGYWGDTAETHILGSNADAADARAMLLQILARTGEQLVPGATGAEVFAEMNAEILGAFPDAEFPHHGGHGLGLGCFEDPHLIPADTTPFTAGMVIAVEPGVYFPGRLGARVENAFIVTTAGGIELREALGH